MNTEVILTIVIVRSKKNSPGDTWLSQRFSPFWPEVLRPRKIRVTMSIGLGLEMKCWWTINKMVFMIIDTIIVLIGESGNQ